MSFQQQPVMHDGNAFAGSRLPYVNYGQSAQLGRNQQVLKDSELATLCAQMSQQYIAPQLPQMSQEGQYFIAQNGSVVWAPATVAQSTSTYGGHSGISQVQFLPQNPYGAYNAGFPVVPQLNQNGRGAQFEVPGLHRRGSHSTIEGSTPGTPSFFAGSNIRQDTGIAALDRSPLYATPSPPGIPLVQYGKGINHVSPRSTNDLYVDKLLVQPPAIPKAIPAVYTLPENLRTLEQSLANPMHKTNVYIRGLHPDTHDDTLAAYAARFGKVVTSKAIIDNATGACKGFGFAMYEDVRDANNCIRGFYKLGYEVGFARESFNSRLKAEGDETSTNLYVSNLPNDMTEAELGAVFQDYVVLSSKILKDSNGNSRGVGFARFESRDVCEEVIKKYHGQPIGEEGLLLQVRYADTGAQKELKRVTTERRKFRTTEYNVGAYGNVADLVTHSPHSPFLGGRVAQLGYQLPMIRDVDGPWKREGSRPNFSTGGISFKDVVRSTVEAREGSNRNRALATEFRSSTPVISESTCSEEGSNGEITIHASPAAKNHDNDSSPSKRA